MISIASVLINCSNPGINFKIMTINPPNNDVGIKLLRTKGICDKSHPINKKAATKKNCEIPVHTTSSPNELMFENIKSIIVIRPIFKTWNDAIEIQYVFKSVKTVASNNYIFFIFSIKY